MKAMNEGYSAQDYYKGGKFRIRLEDGRKDTVANEDYSWCEHISRKAGQWFPKLEESAAPLKECGFELKDNEEAG
jgi:hypothetical protein